MFEQWIFLNFILHIFTWKFPFLSLRFIVGYSLMFCVTIYFIVLQLHWCCWCIFKSKRNSHIRMNFQNLFYGRYALLEELCLSDWLKIEIILKQQFIKFMIKIILLFHHTGCSKIKERKYESITLITQLKNAFQWLF